MVVYSIIYGYALAPFSTDIEQQTVGIGTSLAKCQGIRLCSGTFQC